MKKLTEVIAMLSLLGAVFCYKPVTLIDKPLHSWEDKNDLKVIERRWWSSDSLDDTLKDADGFRLKEDEVKKVIYYPGTGKVTIFYLDR